MSELLVDVCEQLAAAKVIKSTDQQQTKIHRFRHPPTASKAPNSSPLISRGFPPTHLQPAREQLASFQVNCILSSPFASSLVSILVIPTIFHAQICEYLTYQDLGWFFVRS